MVALTNGLIKSTCVPVHNGKQQSFKAQQASTYVFAVVLFHLLVAILCNRINFQIPVLYTKQTQPEDFVLYTQKPNTAIKITLNCCFLMFESLGLQYLHY